MECQMEMRLNTLKPNFFRPFYAFEYVKKSLNNIKSASLILSGVCAKYIADILPSHLYDSTDTVWVEI